MEKKFNFLLDAPAKEDAFGHERIAKAISSILVHNPEIRVVGLTGRWGGGKSSIVGFVERQLKEDEQKHIRVFKYDAWLHQGDPHRRSLLESLITWLKEERVIAGDPWKDELEELRRQVENIETESAPSLTISGKLIILSTFFVPLGISFMGRDWYLQWRDPHLSLFESNIWPIAIGLVFLPAIVSFLIAIWWRPTWKFWKREFWTENRGRMRGKSILSILVNKEHQRHKTKVSKSVEPTSIEFRKLFFKIANRLSKDGKKLVFVIDNIDRLPDVDFYELWSDVRGVFIGEYKGEMHPVVILPVDPDAIQRIHESQCDSEVARVLTRSFLEKTFDIRFEITRPVISDWRTYFKARLREGFNDDLDAEFLRDCCYFIDRKFLKLKSSSSPDPRYLVKLVNDIGVLWEQWKREGISTHVIAYYVINRDEFDLNIDRAIKLEHGPIERIEANWRAQIGAMHFGCSLDHVDQILLEEPLRHSIDSWDRPEFIQLSKNPGFETMLIRLLDAAVAQEVIFDGIDAANFFGSDSDVTSALPSAVWDHLAEWCAASVLGPLDEGVSSAIGLIVRLGRSETAMRRGAALATCLEAVAPNSLQIDGQPTVFAKCLGELWSATEECGLAAWDVNVPGDGQAYLAVAAEVGEPDRVAHLDSGASPDEISGILAGRIGSGTDVESAMHAFAASRLELPRQPIADSALGRLNAGFNAKTKGACFALLQLWSVGDEAKGVIEQAIANQSLPARFNEAFAQGDDESSGRLAALIMLSSKPNLLTTPNGQSWAEVAKRRPKFVSSLYGSLALAGVAGDLAILEKIRARNSALTALIQRTGDVSFSKGSVIMPSGKDVVERWDEYCELFGENQTDFVRSASNSPDFWTALNDLEPEQQLILLSHLVGMGGELDQQATKLAAKALKSYDQQTWLNAITSGEDPYYICEILRDEGKSVSVKGDILDALRATLHDMVRNGSGDLRKRWFCISTIASGPGRKTLMKGVVDHLANGPEMVDVQGVLSANEFQVLRFGEPIRRADEITRHIIIPLVGSEAGKDWLAKNATEFTDIVSKSSKETRDTVSEDLISSNGQDAESAEVVLKKAWKL